MPRAGRSSSKSACDRGVSTLPVSVSSMILLGSMIRRVPVTVLPESVLSSSAPAIDTAAKRMRTDRDRTRDMGRPRTISRLRVSGGQCPPLARKREKETAGATLPRLVRGNVAEVILDRLAVPRRQTFGQPLQRFFLLARGQTTPLLHQ